MDLEGANVEVCPQLYVLANNGDAIMRLTLTLFRPVLVAFRLDKVQSNHYVVTDISGIIMCLHVLVWHLVEDAIGKMSSGALVSVSCVCAYFAIFQCEGLLCYLYDSIGLNRDVRV